MKAGHGRNLWLAGESRCGQCYDGELLDEDYRAEMVPLPNAGKHSLPVKSFHPVSLKLVHVQ